MLEGHGDDAACERDVTEPVEHGGSFTRELGMRIYERERLAKAALRVLVSEETRRACARSQDVVQRLRALAALTVVTSEVLQHFLGAVGVEALERSTGLAVQLRARLVEQSLVGDVADQGLRERQAELGEQLLLVKELERDELGDSASGVFTLGRHGLEHPQGELPPQHGSTLEDALQGRAQPIDSGGQEVVDRLGYAARPFFATPQVAGELLDEIRIALGSSDDQIAERPRLRQQRLHHAPRFRRRERLEREALMEAPLLPRRCVARAVGAENEHTPVGERVDQRPQRFFGAAIDPLEILDEKQLRAVVGRAKHQRLDRLERAALALRLVEALGLQLGRRQREQELAVRHSPHEPRIEPRHPARHLRDLIAFRLAFLESEPQAQNFHDDPKRRRLAAWKAIGLEEPERRSFEASAKLVGEPRFPRPRVADEGHGLPAPRTRALAAVGEKLELTLAADERAEPALDRCVEARALRARAVHGERAHRTVDALDDQLAAILGHEIAVHQTVRGFADQHPSGLTCLLQSGREIHRLSLRRVVHAQVVADLPDHHGPGVEADAQAEFQTALTPKVGRIADERLLNRQRGGDGTRAVILVGNRRAEEGHDPVSRELIHRALVAVYGLHHALEAPVHDPVQLLGIHPGRQGRESGDVGEENRHLLALALDRTPIGEDLLHEVPWRVRSR